VNGHPPPLPKHSDHANFNKLMETTTGNAQRRKPLQPRRIGNVVVGAIGMGTALLAFDTRPMNKDRFLATVRAALDAGVTLIDTADTYAPHPDAIGYAEELVSVAVSSVGNSEDILIATKFGHRRDQNREWTLDGRPEYVRKACDRSLRALKVERIDLYQYHRPDPAVPYAETIGAVEELRKIGKVNMVGISNVNLKQIAAAEAVLGESGLASVQNEFSPRFRSSEGELRYCARRGIAFLAYSPLGGSNYAAQISTRRSAFTDIAAKRGVSPHQVCLAWMLSLAPNVIPLPGATRSTTIRDAAASVDLQLDPEELAKLQVSPRS
jgi:aryl-alcohol dehydrogenase-like predicted oxidoreductase